MRRSPKAFSAIPATSPVSQKAWIVTRGTGAIVRVSFFDSRLMFRLLVHVANGGGFPLVAGRGVLRAADLLDVGRATKRVDAALGAPAHEVDRVGDLCGDVRLHRAAEI